MPTIAELLATGEAASPAIAALDRPPLTYAGLRGQIEATVAALNKLGAGRGDRVAIVLPNGPEMATAFLGVAAGAAAAPLNPAYRADEFEFYLSDLKAKALIVEAGLDRAGGGGRAQARRRHCRTARRALQAGAFTLEGAAGAAARPGLAEVDDIALVLHTSGTTSRPKIVPLSHRNICASARNIATTLALSPADRGLNVMPLFHIHGLIAGLTAPLSRGGSVVCTPGFNALRFFAGR